MRVLLILNYSVSTTLQVVEGTILLLRALGAVTPLGMNHVMLASVWWRCPVPICEAILRLSAEAGPATLRMLLRRKLPIRDPFTVRLQRFLTVAAREGRSSFY